MREHKPNVNWDKNAYLIGIAHRLKVAPTRIDCNVKPSKTGGLLLEVLLDGRDLTGEQERLAMEYLEEAFHGIKPRVEG